MDFLSEWFNLSNLLYLVLLVLGFVVTIVSASLRALVKEITELVKDYRTAMADGKLSEKEKENLLKQFFDVLKEALKIAWSPFKFKVKK
jgi:hypothetical protein